MNEKSPLQLLREKADKQCESYFKKLETERDEIKRAKLEFQILKKRLQIVLTEIKNLSDSKWDEYVNELFEPIVEQSKQISDKVDTLMLKTSTSAKDYEKYQKLKNISKKANQELFEVFDSISLSKKQLERFLIFIYRQMIVTDVLWTQNNLEFYEFTEAVNMSQRRFGFDHNWLVCLSLIQLHENLIKKKIVDLGGDIKEDESIRSLISKLTRLIKENEKREVSFALLLSNGVKTARDTMSHEGFKHSISKKDLGNVWHEILELEVTLYPHNNT